MIFLVAGARPNFMKIAPICRELKRQNLPFKIIHTGQHYDYNMSEAFFKDLEIPEPDYYLGAGSGTHAQQTAKIMIEFEKVCLEKKPDIVIVVGDVNSTLACSITAKKLGVKVAHVEAGLRSRDMSMPEEINRIVTDSISDYFFVTEKSGYENLLKEGKPEERIFFVGNVMIDNLCFQLEKINNFKKNFVTATLKSQLKNYLFLTLHRPSNVDNKKTLSEIFDVLNKVSKKIPIIFPIHPRTKKQIDKFEIKIASSIYMIEPLSFSESLFLWKDAKAVLTDSGGLQEETTALGVPCLTLRENTERPITIEVGTNVLIGRDYALIEKYIYEVLQGNFKKGQVPEKWDGKVSHRIVKILREILK
ncbi:MAG TPA: UDP-N-acetylglucosamine 2-epimerase (non-hydrolyzing) [Candidatus Atribacteria bacterium]|nr:UDP-N-acetylglucosamine 2-epimerase (non-hydrolyzing) [Candidatus Atribacteria bacterium]